MIGGVLLLKILLVPSLVALLTIAGRRWGPAVAGWLSAFPVVAAPVLLIIGLEQGPLFAANTSLSALRGVLGHVAFCLTYAWATLRLPWYLCMGAGAAAFAVVSLLLQSLALPVWSALAVTACGLFIAPALFPHRRFDGRCSKPSALELPARMLAGATLALGITLSAERLGPTLSGALTVFPVLGLVMGVFSHITLGGGGATLLLNRMVRGLHAFAAFCVTAALAMPKMGVLPGTLAALAAALLIQAFTYKRA